MENESNPATYIEHTGPEIWAQSAGQVDYFIHGIGTGGCIAGVGKFLKEKNPACKVSLYLTLTLTLTPTPTLTHTLSP